MSISIGTSNAVTAGNSGPPVHFTVTQATANGPQVLFAHQGVFEAPQGRALSVSVPLQSGLLLTKINGEDTTNKSEKALGLQMEDFGQKGQVGQRVFTFSFPKGPQGMTTLGFGQPGEAPTQTLKFLAFS